MNFTNREEYLAATAIWKASYKSLIIDIRQAKVEYKESQRAFAKCGAYDWKNNSQILFNKTYIEAELKMKRAMYHRAKLRSTATKMIEERHAAKIEAGRQPAR